MKRHQATSGANVPYRGTGPALTALLAGQVQVLITSPPALIEFIKSGKLRGLAVTSAARLKELPDLPPVLETVPGYETSYWYGLGAPKGMAAEIIGTLNTSTNAAIADATLSARLADLGGIPMPMTPSEFGKFVADETEKWSKVIRTAHIEPE